MTLIEQIREWMTKPEAPANAGEAPKAGENKEGETPVALNAQNPTPPDVDLTKRMADLAALVVDLGEKVDALGKIDHTATAMSAIAEIKTELASTKTEVTKLGSQASGEVIDPNKKKVIKPEVEHLGMKKLLA